MFEYADEVAAELKASLSNLDKTVAASVSSLDALDSAKAAA